MSFESVKKKITSINEHFSLQCFALLSLKLKWFMICGILTRRSHHRQELSRIVTHFFYHYIQFHFRWCFSSSLNKKLFSVFSSFYISLRESVSIHSLFLLFLGKWAKVAQRQLYITINISGNDIFRVDLTFHSHLLPLAAAREIVSWELEDDRHFIYVLPEFDSNVIHSTTEEHHKNHGRISWEGWRRDSNTIHE